jgi:hypothetical protein
VISSDQIGNYISNPGSIQLEDIDALDKLAKTYPYCSTIHTLYLKSLAIHTSVHFEHELRKASIHVHDREQLYKLIHSQDLPKVQELELDQSSEIEGKPLEPIESNSLLIVEKDSAKEELVLPLKEIEIAKPLEVEPTISKVVETNVVVEVPENLSLEALEPEINLAYFEVEMLLDQAPLEPKQQAAVAPENILEIEEIESFDSTKTSETTETELSATEDDNNLSFVAWLKKKQAKKSHSEEIIPLAVVEFEPTIRSKQEINALLDKFIQDQPTISRPTQDFFNPVKNAKRSLEESEDLVTETLAEIYYLQKNFTKAITSYEKLILLYPEKKTFFASRIEKIREEIKKK